MSPSQTRPSPLTGSSPARRLVARKPRLSRTRKPEDMTLEAWQTALRRQFGREQKFKLVNLGREPVFSDFAITNPQSRRTYRVAIRGNGLGDNFCTCPDFVTNTLGTCKHIEFTLARLRHIKGGARALKAGHHPPYSEIYLQYGAQRIVRIRIGTDCPPDLRTLIGEYFKDGALRPDAFAKFNEFLSATARFEHELRCHDDVLSFIAEVRDRDRRTQLIDAAFPRGIHSPALDTLLKVKLYDYQKEGALFAVRAGRCLIGDEMGLGKTIQAIAAAQIMAEHLGVQRVLIVAAIVQKWRHRGFLTESEQRRLTIALQFMRMSCDSTYLLDQETDFGVKADELATLLGEMYERPGTKVVIFSQWVRMHELLVRRLEKNAWDHVLFHGGVESGKRGALIDRFRADERCRAFLSRGPEPSARLRGREHGSAVEPGRPRAAHRPGASPWPEPAGAGGELRRPGDDRARHALGAEVQEVAVRGGAGWRREGSFPGWLAAEEVHGVGRKCDRRHTAGDARGAGGTGGSRRTGGARPPPRRSAPRGRCPATSAAPAACPGRAFSAGGRPLDRSADDGSGDSGAVGGRGAPRRGASGIGGRSPQRRAVPGPSRSSDW